MATMYYKVRLKHFIARNQSGSDLNGLKMIGYALSVVVACALVAPQVLCYDFTNKGTCGLKPWIKRGCRIALDHSLTLQFDIREQEKNNIDWNNLHPWLTNFACKCRQKALDSKHTFFGLGDYGLCYSGTGLNEYIEKHPLAPEGSCIGVLKHNHTVVNEKTGEVCLAGYSRLYLYQIVTGAENPMSTEGNNEGEQVVDKICTSKSDIIIAVDASASLDTEFPKVKFFLKKLISRFEVGKGTDKSRLSILSFADKANLLMSWADSQVLTKSQINTLVDKMPFAGGGTATYDAIKMAVNDIIKPFRRTGVTPTVFLITDGECFRGDFMLPGPIKLLRETKARVIAIGVGDANKYELKDITGDERLVLFYKNFQNILDMAATILNKLVVEACV
ncbi:collagen alpha-5(VI) chain [Exaiptasia diaphana]|uniref:VWFA domain-containing protein n=1 Tax=Exaiptasia diaphana TaxID=2652724 RepID=A0A913X0W5_EXADI|nr:collagen alpha-5(VI) chain [Exaiptasia diaphana]KXJ30012.1 Collagen alpha-5(VI) chain [Exaiptasia diaphana]